MRAEIIVPKWAASDLIAATPRNPNPHLIFHRSAILLVTPCEWRDRYRPEGALLIMTRDHLAELAPDALDLDPAVLADLLTGYAGNFDPS